jgi:raffinose/stachyose/melibiose transport system permease protein
MALVIPGFIIFSIGIVMPMFLSLGYSFTDWDGMTGDRTFVFFNNYIRMFRDQNALNAWKFTLLFTIGNTVIQNVCALGFALILNSSIRFRKTYRTILFMPCLISAVVTGYIWLKLFSNVLPTLANALGIDVNFMLLGNRDTVLYGLLIANNWQWIGYWMLIYLAALQSIPPELYEAAEIDGAGTIRQFGSVTVPMLAPAFTICIVGITVGSLKVYDLMVSSTQGGPGRASTSIIYQIYNTAIGGRQYGYGSALSVSLIVVLLIVAAVQLNVLREREVQL